MTRKLEKYENFLEFFEKRLIFCRNMMILVSGKFVGNFLEKCGEMGGLTILFVAHGNF